MSPALLAATSVEQTIALDEGTEVPPWSDVPPPPDAICQPTGNDHAR